MKCNFFFFIIKMIEINVRRGKRCVAAQFYFVYWSHPTNGKIIIPRNNKCSLCKIMLRGNLLQQLIIQPLLQRHNSSGIAPKSSFGKSVNDKHFQLHKYIFYYTNFKRITRIVLKYKSLVCKRFFSKVRDDAEF